MPLEVRWEKVPSLLLGPLAIELGRKGRFLVVVLAKYTPRLSTDTVERARKALRKETLGCFHLIMPLALTLLERNFLKLAVTR